MQPSLKQISGLNSALAAKVGTASNVGTLGVGLFKQKNGTNLEFNNLVAGTGINALTVDGNNNVSIGVNAGTGANQIVQLDGSSRLPAVDGSQLTNLPTGVPTLPQGQIFVGNESNNAAAVATSTVALSAWGAPTADISLGSYKISTSATTFNGNQFVTKTYVDALLASGSSNWKLSCKVASVSNVNLATNLGGAPHNSAALDNADIYPDDRVLLKNQTNQAENGIYYWASNGLLQRTADANSDQALQGMVTYVERGTTQHDTIWGLITDYNITVGTTNLTFTQIGGMTGMTANGGITIAGSQISVKTTGVTTGLVSDNVAVRSTGTQYQVLQSTGTSGAEASWGALNLASSNAVTGTLAVGNGGTGLSSIAAYSVMVTQGTASTTSTIALAANSVLGRSTGGITSLSSANIRAIATVRPVTDVGTATNGSMTLLTLTQTPAATSGVAVFYRGVLLEPTTDYTISGTTVTATSALNVEYGGTGTDGQGFTTGDKVIAFYTY